MATKKPETQMREAMQSLGTYKSQYDPAIEILCQLKRQYDVLTKQFEDGGYKYYEETVSGSKKAPIVITLEGLRRDILNYMSQLGLTPQGLKKLNEQATRPDNSKPVNALVQALRGLDD